MAQSDNPQSRPHEEASEPIAEYLRQDDQVDFDDDTSSGDPYEEYLRTQRATRDRRRRHLAQVSRPRIALTPSADSHGNVHSPQPKPYWKTQKEFYRENLAAGDSHQEPSPTTPTRRTRRVQPQTLEALQVLGMRQTSYTEEWQAFLSNTSSHLSVDSDERMDTGKDEEQFKRKHNDHDHQRHQLMVPMYCAPVQRQLWDDDQVLPHVNWHDLFFDLIFVAAAYNLGVMLISAMNKSDWPRGVLYFLGIFGPLYTIWENDVIYASRYTLVDYSHRLVAVLRFLFVSFAVLSIKPLKLLGDKHSAETFCLVLSLFFESLVQLCLNLELYWYGEGDRTAIRNQTRRETIAHLLPATLAYLEATLIAGWSLFMDDSSSHDITTAHSNIYNHRVLGQASNYLNSSQEYRMQEGFQWSIADLPIFLCLLAYISNILSTLYRRSTHNKKEHSIREYFVPCNIDYLIHRYGEWIMLMIGESILSLLIVETTEAKEYYAIEILGWVTVIILQILMFESQPSQADGHALWRSMTAASLYSLLIQTLSMGLIAFGISYKLELFMVLKEKTYSSNNDAYHRELAEMPNVTEKADAWLFSFSLALVLTSLELMMVTHKGIAKTYLLLFRIHKETPHKWSMNWPVVLTTIAKVGIIGFSVTLELWVTDPYYLTMIGFLIVAAMAVIRIVGWGFVHHEEYINRTITDVSQRMSALVKKVSFYEEAGGLPLTSKSGHGEGKVQGKISNGKS